MFSSFKQIENLSITEEKNQKSTKQKKDDIIDKKKKIKNPDRNKNL